MGSTWSLSPIQASNKSFSVRSRDERCCNPYNPTSTLSWLMEDVIIASLSMKVGGLKETHKCAAQWNILGQNATSRCEGFPMPRQLTPSSLSGRTGGLVEPKLTIISFVSTKLPAHPEYWEFVPKISENLHILMQPCAWENFIEFCHHKSFRT